MTTKSIKASTGKIHNEEEASRNEDHFLRLPEELIISIFTRVADVNSLCRCSLVSNYFASLVYCVKTVAVNPIPIPVVEPTFENSRARVQQLKQLKLVKFLKHFRDLESIYLVDTWLLENWTNSWKVKFSSDGTEIERLVILLPTSVHRNGQPDLDLLSPDIVSSPDIGIELLHIQFLEWFYDRVNLLYAHLIEWMCLVRVLVKGHSSLRRVFIADSEKHGKLFMEDEQLDGVKSLINDSRVMLLQLAIVPVLRLPSSGIVMSKVYFGSISHPKAPCIDEMSSWEFEDEEKVLGEATKEILEHHRHCMHPVKLQFMIY